MEIEIQGMHCDACEKTITRALAKEDITIRRISYKTGKATVEGDMDKERIARIISTKGYSLKHPKSEPSRQERKNTEVEKTMLVNGIFVLGTLLIVQTLLTIGIYARLPGYVPRQFWLFIIIPIALTANIIALWHQRAYRKEVSCMTGMMVGMTIGMTTGFMVGAIFGLTNGMFWGSVIGTLVGIGAGVYAGRCCGTMGVMEGTMAGLMSGTMGAMLTVMMVSDHPEWFMAFLFVICIAILGGMMRTTWEENHETRVEAWPVSSVIAVTFSIMLILSMLILVLPKGIY